MSVLKNKYVAAFSGSWTESTELSFPVASKQECSGKKVGAGGLSGIRERLGGLLSWQHFLILPMALKVEVLKFSKIEAYCIFSLKF